MMIASHARVHLVDTAASGPERRDAVLDVVFFALADPVRRDILAMIDGRDLTVSEVAAPFAISLQAVSKHIQVLVRAGLLRQERSGRISRCSLITGPIFDAAVWLNRYSKYWQSQFDLLAATLTEIEENREQGLPGRAGRAHAPEKPTEHADRARQRSRKRKPGTGST